MKMPDWLYAWMLRQQTYGQSRILQHTILSLLVFGLIWFFAVQLLNSPPRFGGM